MNSFHFTLGSSRVPRVRWFTGLQCGNPWFIANTLACHCAIPDTMVAYALCPRVQRTLYSFSVSSPSSLPSLLRHTWACLREWAARRRKDEDPRDRGRGIYAICLRWQHGTDNSKLRHRLFISEKFSFWLSHARLATFAATSFLYRRHYNHFWYSYTTYYNII